MQMHACLCLGSLSATIKQVLLCSILLKCLWHPIDGAKWFRIQDRECVL